MLPACFAATGSDRYLTMDETITATAPHPLSALAWNVYASHFRRFTGATLDPLCHRLSHPAARQGALRLEPGTSVLVVGAGPSLDAQLEPLRRLAGRVRIFTSPRGAEILLTRDIVPDVVLIEHQTALDAHHSARHLVDCAHPVLGACPLVAADWRTPAALLAGLDPSSLFVPSPLPTWGLWPATAAAMAIEAGASRVALVGVDLGTAAAPDPAHAPLSAVLSLLARLAPVVAIDCGTGGAVKEGWLPASIDDAAGLRQRGRCEVEATNAPAVDERVLAARRGLRELAPVLARAGQLLALATAARRGDARRMESALANGVAETLAWRDDARRRALLQECLGVSLLPRLWRTGVDLSLGSALWRPLLLGTHEIVKQAAAVEGFTAVGKAA